MARRTRRFESLEERRLLAAGLSEAVSTSPAVSNSPDASALVASASPTTSAATQPSAANPSTGSSSTANAPASANDTSGAAATDTGGNANSSWTGAAISSNAVNTAQSSDGSSGSSSEYGTYSTATDTTAPGSTEYYPAVDSNNTGHSNYTVPTTPAADTSSQSAQASVIQVLQTGQASTVTTGVQAAVLAPAAPVALAPAGGAPGGPVRFDAHDLVARQEFDESTSEATPVAVGGDEPQLVAPVAWAMSSEEEAMALLDDDEEAVLETDLPSLLAHAPQLASLVAGAAGAEWSHLERGVDELFERLERLGEELPSVAAARHVGECAVLTAGAAAAFEYVRAQIREGGAWQGFVDGGREPWEPRLRRRWFRRKADRSMQR